MNVPEIKKLIEKLLDKTTTKTFSMNDCDFCLMGWTGENARKTLGLSPKQAMELFCLFPKDKDCDPTGKVKKGIWAGIRAPMHLNGWIGRKTAARILKRMIKRKVDAS